MKHTLLTTLPAFVLPLALGCAVLPGGEEGFEGVDESAAHQFDDDDGLEVGESKQALFGNISVDGSRSDVERIGALIPRIRSAVRSNAFSECLDKAIRRGTGDYGPYRECKNSDPKMGDMYRTSSVDRHIARAHTAAGNQYGVSVSVRHFSGNVGAFSTGNDLSNGVQKMAVKWLRGAFNSDEALMARSIVHEALHAHGYQHGCLVTPTNGTYNTDSSCDNAASCGYSSSEYNVDFQPMNAVVAGCVMDVMSQGEEDCSESCPTGYYALPAYFESTSCACVPDEFGKSEVVMEINLAATDFDPEHVNQITRKTNENEAGDQFGMSTAVGNFDSDLYDDLAVGAPGEDSGAGAVYLFRGSPTGLKFWARITQKDLGWSHEAGDRFGFSLAAGDFDDDLVDDLVIGSPGENQDAGYVHVIPGKRSGLLDYGARRSFQQPYSDAQAGDQHGYSLAVGDFDGDRITDLAAGAPTEMWSGRSTGATVVYRGTGTSSLLKGWRALVVNEYYGVALKDGDRFGFALAAGDFDNDEVAELAIGAPGRVEAAGTGAAFIADLDAGSWDVPVGTFSPESGDVGYGESLAAGQFTARSGWKGDGLAVGSPRAGDGGKVFVYRGAAVSAATCNFFCRLFYWGAPLAELAWVVPESGDAYGTALAVADTGSGPALWAGVPGDLDRSGMAISYRQSSTSQDGSKYVWSGYASQTMQFKTFTGDSLYPSAADRGAFGTAMASGDFNGDGETDIVFGAPHDQVVLPDGSKPASGAVFVFNSQASGSAVRHALTINQATMEFGDAILKPE